MNAIAQKTIASIAHHCNGAASRVVLTPNPAGETILLRSNQLMHIDGAAGWTIRALGGAAWITQDGDIRDVVIEAGQAYMPDRPGDVLVSPLGEARLYMVRSSDVRRCTTLEIAPANVRAAFA